MQENAAYIAELSARFEQFIEKPPQVLLIKGAIGAGKTGYAWSFLNHQRSLGEDVAGISYYEFNSCYFAYVFEHDDTFPALLAFLQQVNTLLLDDFGCQLRDRSETQTKAAEMLKEIVEFRIRQGRVTLITVAFGRSGPTIHLASKHPAIHVGDSDLRRLLSDRSPLDEYSEDEAARSKVEAALVNYSWLSRGWLSEKMSKIERYFQLAIERLITPEEQLKAEYPRWKEQYGEEITRDEELKSLLQGAQSTLREYREFVATLPFEAIQFGSDGSRELIVSSRTDPAE